MGDSLLALDGLTLHYGGSQILHGIDLQAATVSIGGTAYPFDLDPVWRAKLIRGWDDIDLTASHLDRIAAFRDTRRDAHPWAWPAQ